MTFNQIGRDIPTFADAASVADLIIKSSVKYDSVVIVYNKFMSAISFESHAVKVQTEVSLRDSEARAFTFVSQRANTDCKGSQPGSSHMRWKTISPKILASLL